MLLEQVERIKPELERLEGTVERVTYHHAENGFCVLKVAVKGKRDLITVIGNIPFITIGEYIKSEGSWGQHREHGIQFQAERLYTVLPGTRDGIEHYLASGVIKGIGAHFAKELMQRFGMDILEVLDKTPEKLREIPGIGSLRLTRICVSWTEQKMVRDIMIFLQSHGVSTARATRIYRTYGDQAVQIVSENPYRLARDIRGIGFLSADTIAKHMNIANDSLLRLRAGIYHVLMEAVGEGHCGLPYDDLLERSTTLLEAPQDLIKQAIHTECDTDGLLKISYPEQEMIFLASYDHYESEIAEMLHQLMQNKVKKLEINDNEIIASVEKKIGITLSESQKQAVMTVEKSPVFILTGGPGTGKTTLVNVLLHLSKTYASRVMLCAPTGRAAKRLEESTGAEAKTIHRLLGVDRKAGGFKHNIKNPLSCDLLIVDEMSMVDIPLFYALLRALPPKANIIMVGDPDQLPSVGAGQVLNDMMTSHIIPTVSLSHIFRQASQSRIIVNAHRVNEGEFPYLKNEHKDSDFYFVPAATGEEAAQKIVTMVQKRIPERFGFNPIRDIQVLCPMQRGAAGARALNASLQSVLNPNPSGWIEKFGQRYAVGDKIMQTENDHDNAIYNGDIGTIQAIDPDEKTVTLNFDQHMIEYDYQDMDRVTLAYATTIHKAQGSEYPVVVIPFLVSHFMMLERRLLYTAMTRGRKLVILVGEKRALAIALHDTKRKQRYTRLKAWLEKLNS